MNPALKPPVLSSPLLAGWSRFVRPFLRLGFLFFLFKGIVWMLIGWMAWSAKR